MSGAQREATIRWEGRNQPAAGSRSSSLQAGNSPRTPELQQVISLKEFPVGRLEAGTFWDHGLWNLHLSSSWIILETSQVPTNTSIHFSVSGCPIWRMRLKVLASLLAAK